MNIIKNAIRHIEYVPVNYLEWMANLYKPSKLENK